MFENPFIIKITQCFAQNPLIEQYFMEMIEDFKHRGNYTIFF